MNPQCSPFSNHSAERLWGLDHVRLTLAKVEHGKEIGDNKTTFLYTGNKQELSVMLPFHVSRF